MTEPRLTVVQTVHRPESACPTPADVRRQQTADQLLGVLEDAAARDHAGAADPTETVVPLPANSVAVPVLGVPMRRDVPGDFPTFTARVVDEDRPNAAPHLVRGVTHWRIHDGALSLYGVLDGRSYKLETINALHWTRVERLAGGAR